MAERDHQEGTKAPSYIKNGGSNSIRSSVDVETSPTNMLSSSPNEEEKTEEVHINYTGLPLAPDEQDNIANPKETAEQTDDMTIKDNGALTSNNVASPSSGESYGTRLRRKMMNEQNTREVIQSPNIPKKRGFKERNDKETPSNGKSSSLFDGEENSCGEAMSAAPNNAKVASVNEVGESPGGTTPGAFAETGRAIGARPAWARVRASMLRNRQSDVSQNTETNGAEALEAVVVDESKEKEEIEKQIRLEISKETVIPDSVEKVESPRQRRTKRALLILLAIAGVITITALSVKLTNDKNQGEDHMTPVPTLNPNPTLQQITEAGMLKCYIFFENEVDFCRALAAAVFGREDLEDKMYLISGSKYDSLATLANGTVDVLFGTTHTMERDLYQKDAEVGFTFTVPFLYDGLTFGGVPEFVECADELNTFNNCSNLKICVVEDSLPFKFLDMRLPASAIVPTTSNNPIVNKIEDFLAKKCNVIGSIYPFVANRFVEQFGDIGNYTVGNKLHTKTPLSFVTRDNDPEWSDFVNAVVQSLFAAAAMNITNDTAAEFGKTSLFSDKYENMSIDAIAEVGSFEGILSRHNIFVHGDINQFNINGSTGLIYSLPFGDTKRDGPGPVPGGTLEGILKRGKLLCGIRINRPGFAYYNDNEQTYTGLDVDYCHTLASGIFRSNRTAVDFVPFDENNTSDVFKALDNRMLDVAAGIGINLESDVREPSTGEGYSFSAPFFYDPPEGPLKTSLSLVTRQDDPQWSAIVYWIVMATFYAEENGLTYDLSYEMPLVNILGPYVDSNNNKVRDFTRLLRDAILVGNYGELYKRNVEVYVPRSGRNQLNKDPLGPQLNPYLLF